MKQTRQAVRAIKQSILLRCLWLDPFVSYEENEVLRIRLLERDNVLVKG